jgi:hypothetical protein
MHPMTGTIFERSTTPLHVWFYVIFLMATTRSGISAKHIERMIGVTYKTAWRMMHKIRSLMAKQPEILSGIVEVDEMYMGAQARRRNNAGKKKNEMIFGMIERGGGKAIAKHLPKRGRNLIIEIKRHVPDKHTVMYSDNLQAYKALYYEGYKHYSIPHYYYTTQYVKDGHIHTQSIENLWSNLKPPMKGVFKHISPRHLQSYVNEYVWRFNHRFEPNMFLSLMEEIK